MIIRIGLLAQLARAPDLHSGGRGFKSLTTHQESPYRTTIYVGRFIDLRYNIRMKVTVYAVNAFTANGSGGNPAGVVLDASSLSESQMQLVATKMGFAETAFVSASSIATRQVRFFTPTNELDLCGHATIATWSLLAAHKLVPFGQHTQATGVGILKLSITNDGLVFMEQTKATFYGMIVPDDLAPLLSIDATDFYSTLPPQMVSTGIKDVVVAVKDKTVLANIQPDLPAIIDFSRPRKISSIHVFTLLENGHSLAAARNFAPIDGIPEEAATGTSSGALLCYLRDHHRLPQQQEPYRMEQGEGMGRLSYIYGRFEDDIIWIGGRAKVMGKQVIEL